MLFLFVLFFCLSTVGVKYVFHFWSGLLSERKCKKSMGVVHRTKFYPVNSYPIIVFAFDQPIFNHWIGSCPVDNLIQWITLSCILNNRAQFDKLEKELIHCLNSLMYIWKRSKGFWSSLMLKKKFTSDI